MYEGKIHLSPTPPPSLAARKYDHFYVLATKVHKVIFNPHNYQILTS